MFVLLFACLAAIWLLVKYVQYKRMEMHLKRINGPPTLPLLGNALDIKNTSDILPTLLKYQEKYNGITKLIVGFDFDIIISNPKFVEHILSSTKIIEKASGYKFLGNWLGSGLITSPGSKWKKHRKIITPAFHFKVLEQFIEVFNSASDILAEKLRRVAAKDVDIYPYITRCALDIICETAMGTSTNAQNNADSAYTQSVKEVCRIIISRSYSPFAQYDLLYFFTSDYRKEQKALEMLHGYTASVICKRKAEMEAENSDITEDKEDRKLVFIDLLLRATVDGVPLSDKDIREEVDTIMFAGHDTTSSAISFTLHCLAKYPDVQIKVYEEQKDIFGNETDRSANFSDLQSMRYLEMVIKECLRLYPTVPQFSRMPMEDITYDGVVLPKGISLSIFTYGLHRNPEIFPYPEKFDPDRFSHENQTGRSQYAYIPFSAGPRNCIGQKYAMLEMKAMISKLLRSFEILPTFPEHEPTLVAETVLKSANGIWVKLKERVTFLS